MITSGNAGGNNPYLKGSEGRKEWNDRYGTMRQAVRTWQIAFFCALAINLIFASIIARMAATTRVQPFIVETNRGMPYAITALRATSTQDPRIINFAVNQFIINTRSIIHDTTAEKTLLTKAYAFSANHTIRFLRDYYQKHDPFQRSTQITVAVQIINTLPISHHTWQVTWDETQYSNSDNRILSVTRWMAHLSIQFGKINPAFINDNPFGIYITNVFWSQSQIGDPNVSL